MSSNQPSLSPRGTSKVQPITLNPSYCDISSYEPDFGLHVGLIAGGVALAILPGYIRLFRERDVRKKWFFCVENAVRGVGTGLALYPALRVVLAITAGGCGQVYDDGLRQNSIASWVIIIVVFVEALIDCNAFFFGKPWEKGNLGYDTMRWKLSKTAGFAHTSCYMIVVPAFLFMNWALLLGNNWELRDAVGTPFWPTWFVGIVNVIFALLLVLPVLAVVCCGICFLGGEFCGCGRFNEKHFKNMSPLRALWAGSKIINMDIMGLIVALYTNRILVFSWSAELILDVGLLFTEWMGGCGESSIQLPSVSV